MARPASVLPQLLGGDESSRAGLRGFEMTRLRGADRQMGVVFFGSMEYVPQVLISVSGSVTCLTVRLEGGHKHGQQERALRRL